MDPELLVTAVRYVVSICAKQAIVNAMSYRCDCAWANTSTTSGLNMLPHYIIVFRQASLDPLFMKLAGSW